jgi:hypothetical protein
MVWAYEKTPLNGGAPGDAFKSIFNGSGKNQAETLAREAIQNSVDAAADAGTSVVVDFRFVSLSGNKRRAFEKAADLSEIAKRRDGLGLLPGNILERHDSPLQLLYIDDYETTGLSGDPTSPNSNLRKLLMDLGGSGKAHQTEATGGSYGFGKAVYSSSSRIGTIFVFSRTRDANGSETSVLMGCAYQQGHEFNDISWTGRGFFGVPVKIEGEGIRFDPFLGSDAEKLACKLGFERDVGEGTSILIVDAAIEPEETRRGIENWWWPRIQARLLDARVISEDGTASVPRPKLQKHLKPFIDAFYAARKQTPQIPGTLELEEFRRSGEKSIGTMGLTVVDDSENENPFGENYEEWLDTVALIRSPLMVVSYHRKWRTSPAAPVVVGCFIAHEDVDFVLKLSEPPDHSRWDPSADRVLSHDEAAPQLITSILGRIKSRFRRFQDAAKPPAPPRPKRLEKLERALASWFGVGSNGGKQGPDPNPAPISLKPEQPHLFMEGQELRAKGKVEIALSASEESEQWFRVRLGLQVAEEDGISAKDPIELEIQSSVALEANEDGYFLGRVGPGEVVTLEYQSAPYDPDWTVRLMPEVLPVESKNKDAA